MSMSCADLCIYFSHLMDYNVHLMKEENKRTGKNIQEVTFILDLEGFAIQQILHKCVMEMGVDFVSLLQDCYPEAWSHVLIINAPKIFDTAFNLFKPLLRAPALERLQVADKNSSKDLLLQYIDEDVLPVFLGGTRVDSNGDPKCREFISFGGKVSEKFYSENQRIPLRPSDPDVKCVMIRPRSMYILSIPIREPGCKARLQFRTENGSIAITGFFKELNPDLGDNQELPAEDEYLDETTENFKYKQITVEIRGQSHCTQEDCTIDTIPGIYIMRFSNARNWFTSRKFLIKWEVIPSKQENVS